MAAALPSPCSPWPDGGTVTTHQDITEQRRSEAKIAHMALHDALTGLPNRALLNERLEHAIARANRGEMVATHLLDLDHFKTSTIRSAIPPATSSCRWWPTALRGLRAGDRHRRAHGRRRVRDCAGGIAEPADATSLALRIIDVAQRTL